MVVYVGPTTVIGMDPSGMFILENQALDRAFESNFLFWKDLVRNLFEKECSMKPFHWTEVTHDLRIQSML